MSDQRSETGVGVDEARTGSPEPAVAANATDPHPGQELVTQRKDKAALATGEGGYIVPTNIEEAYRYAQAIVAAGLAPDSYNRDPQKVMLGLLAAMEAGLPPLYGLRQIAIINGRPTIWGDAAMALIQSKNLLVRQHVEEIGFWSEAPDDFEQAFDPASTDIKDWPDNYGYRVQLWRRGQEEPYVGEFTVGDAKRGGLWMNTRKAPWLTSPRRMLMIRARAFPQRDGFADALAGLAIREEIEDVFGDNPVHDPARLEDAPMVEVPPMPEEIEQ